MVHFHDAKDFWMATLSGLAISIVLLTVDLLKDLVSNDLKMLTIDIVALSFSLIIFIFAGWKYDYFKQALHLIELTKNK